MDRYKQKQDFFKLRLTKINEEYIIFTIIYSGDKMENQDILKLLCNRNCYVQVNVCVYQLWKAYNTFSCIGTPKENDLLLFVNRCKLTYTMANGEKIILKHGDIAHIPSGKEYVLTVDERDEEYGCTYGINFLLFDEDHNRLVINENKVFHSSELRDFFQEMSRISELGSPSYAQMQSIFYQIIVSLNDRERKGDIKGFSVIEKGIKYLENDPLLALSVLEIAKMCNVSQNYFCRLFKEYSGVTPQEYVLRIKIERAKIALKETSFSVSEIAEQCGFQDSSYFSRIFKKKTGLTPMNFRNARHILSVDKMRNMNV